MATITISQTVTEAHECGCVLVITDGGLDSRTTTCERHEVSQAYGNITLKPRLADWEAKFLATYAEVSRDWPL